MLPLVLLVLVYGNGPDLPAVRARIGRAAAAHGARLVDHAVETALQERKEGWRSVAELAFFDEARRAVDRAHRARERVELDEALRALGEAEAVYEAHLDQPGVASQLAEVALDRGVVLGELRHVDEARAAFQRALSLAPELTLTERHARPDVVRLLKDVARGPIVPAVLPARGADPLAEPIASLRSAPSEPGLRALLSALGADRAIVAVVSQDGKRMIATAVERTCATESLPYDLLRPDEAVVDLLRRPCRSAPFQLSLDDPRLAPAPIVVSHAAPRPAAPRKWPYIFAGALGVTAAVIGVTVGVIASDPRYALKIDGRAFGAP